MSQSNLDPEIRDYAAGIIDWKKRGSPAAVRDLTPTDEQAQRWVSALKTAERTGKNAALLEFMEPSRREWLRRSTSVWLDVVVDLLSDTNQTVRFVAAELLSEVEDERAMPVLIEGLESDRLNIRKECWEDVVKLCGKRVPYDPEAAQEERAASVALWRIWYERQRQRESRPAAGE